MKKYSLLIVLIIFFIIKTPQTFAKTAVQYQYLMEEKTVEEMIIASVDDIIITKQQNLTYVKRSIFWEKVFVDEENIRIIKFNDKYLISSILEDKIKVRILDKEGNITCEQFLDDNPVGNDYDCKFREGYFYFVGSIDQYQSKKFIQAKSNKVLNNRDAFLIKASHDFTQIKVKVFGGYLNESFKRIVIDNDHLIIAGLKDQTTGGDFGNGGQNLTDNLLVAKFTFDLQMICYNIINANSPIISFDFKEDAIYIITQRECLIIDRDLQMINSLNHEEVIYSYLGNDLLVLFTYNDIILYSLKGFNLESYYTFHDKLEEILNVIAINDAFWVYFNQENNLKCLTVDILRIKNNTKQICVLDYCSLPEQKVKVDTLFKEAKLISVISSPYYNRNIHGEYEFILSFLIRENKEINLKSILEICLESNVHEGGIYPLGYRLKFTGHAKLNNREIFNNYPLDKEGSYELVLLDCLGQETKYNFRVDKKQFSFNEPVYKSWDITACQNSQFSINLNLSKERYHKLNQINFSKDYQQTDYDEEKEELTIYFKSPDAEGLYVYCLEALTFTDKTIELNYLYVINVLKKPPTVEVTPNNNNTLYFCRFDDLDNTLRYLEVKVIQNQKENIYLYSIGNNPLIISNIDINNKLNIEISFLYDLGDNQHKNIKILDLEIRANKENITLGYLDLIKSAQSIEEVNLELSNPSKDYKIKSIQYNNLEISLKDKSSKYIFIVLVFLGLVSFVLTRIIKIKSEKSIK